MADEQPQVSRHPHTVYLTDEVWAALDRAHLETRLREGKAGPSKMEFVEATLSAGLAAIGESPARSLSRRRGCQDVDRVTVTGAAEPAAPGEQPATQSAAAPPASEGTPEHEEKRRVRRSGALERLKQASDPGRPAPIRSAAETESRE
jgi:hypothetical protein